MTTRSARAGRAPPLRPRSECGDAHLVPGRGHECVGVENVRGATEAFHFRCPVSGVGLPATGCSAARTRVSGTAPAAQAGGQGDRAGRRPRAGPPAAEALDRGDVRALHLRALAKRSVTDAGYSAIDRARQLHRRYGCLSDDGIEKIVRDLRVHQILEGTNEIMRVIVARGLTEAFR